MGDGNEGAVTRELGREGRLTRVEVKLDTLTEKVDELNVKLVQRVEEHEYRLVRVERIVWLISGMFVLFGVPVVLILLAQLLGRLF